MRGSPAPNRAELNEMPTYKGFEYELVEFTDHWRWKVVSGEQTRSGRNVHKAVATVQALKAIDSMRKNKRIAAAKKGQVDRVAGT